MKPKNAAGAHLDDSLITSGGGTNAEASNIQTSHIQPGVADQSAEGDYPAFNAQSNMMSENRAVAQAPSVAQGSGQPLDAAGTTQSHQ